MHTLDITIGEPHEEGVYDIIKVIRPTWTTDRLLLKNLEGGHVNRLYYCGMKDDAVEDDVLVIKVYGTSSEGLLDREKEIINMKVAHSVGLGSPLYCRFNNGLVYKYYRGSTVPSEIVCSEDFNREMARQLAALHQVDYTKALSDLGHKGDTTVIPFIIQIIEIVKSILPAIKNSYEDPIKEAIRAAEFPSGDVYMADMKAYGDELQALDTPMAFCHSDTNSGNIIWDPTTGAVNLIDWEFCGLDYVAHEIGWYFAGRVFVNDCAEESLNNYPDMEEQLHWIRLYLEERARLLGTDPKSIPAEETKKLYKASVIAVLMRITGFITFLLMEDHTPPGNSNSFRKARNMQKLLVTIKARL